MSETIKIPTAEVFFEQGGTYPELAVQFAKLHVKAALQAAAKNMVLIPHWKGGVIVDLNSIVNAYPDENIH